MLHLKAGLLHEPQKRREVGAFLLQSRHDPLSIMEKAALAVLLWALNDRQLVLNAHPVREPPHRKAVAGEVMEFPGTVLGGGVVINVIVNVPFVNVGTDKELILALCPAPFPVPGAARGSAYQTPRKAALLPDRQNPVHASFP